MRRLALASILLLAGCATTPQQPAAQPQAPATPAPQPHEIGSLIGVTASDLVGRFGNPALQVREGTSLKLQFRSWQCVLDAYLYPSQSGVLRVTHVDARTPQGIDRDQAGCVATLEAGRI